MKKSPIYFIIFFVQGFLVHAQASLYDFVQPGTFPVGYQDTLVFDTAYTYEAYGYTGAKPQFVHIWYPLPEKVVTPEYLSFKDFFGPMARNPKPADSRPHLLTVQKELEKHYREAIIRDCLEENLLTGDRNDFGGYTYSDMLNFIDSIETKSILNKNHKKSNFPIIIYHHGSQSFPFENYAMAEYFASRGFIFVSANFHLPFEGAQFGLKPFDKYIAGEDEESLKNVVKFAQSLSNNPAMFFIGHSWGAQMGFRTFAQDTTIKGLISLETTIEFKEDTSAIQEFWPEVYQKVAIEKAYFPFPVLLCAATGQEKPFPFLCNLNAEGLTFLSTKEQFEHNAYTSIFYTRYFINKNVKQSDKEILYDRLKLYLKHLSEMEKFMDATLKNEQRKESSVTLIK